MELSMSNLNNNNVGADLCVCPQAPTVTAVAPTAHDLEQLMGLRKSVALDTSKLPAFLQDYLAICRRFTDAEEGALLTALLPVIAVNIANRVFVQMRSRRIKCHLWAVIAGKSTISRKSTAIELAEHTIAPYLRELDKMSSELRQQKNPILGTTTLARTINLLAANPNRLFIFNEFSVLMLGNKHTYNSGMQQVLTDVYDGKSRDFATMERNDRVINPAVSILAGSTEGNVYQFFKCPEERDSGFTQRFLYNIIVTDDKQFRTNWVDIEQDYTDLEKLDAIYSVFRSIPKAQQLRLSEGAKIMWADTHDAIMNSIDANEDDLLSYSARIFNDSFPSFCIIFELMKNYRQLQLAIESQTVDNFFNNLEVSEKTAEEALYLCGYYLANARPLVRMLKAGGSWQNETRIIHYLQNSKDGKASRSTLMRALSLNAKTMNECLVNLKEMEYISELSVSCTGTYKKATMYKLNTSPQS
jgi:hypothetical protein